ncbi:5-(carboxyamino)imidazole ribonucleotide mutase [Leptolyngbya sp. AN02str]|uniref:5-(carboxyamino)imidazole ribonucleotide mutase n=1 Tax=Leptolyngbya sp. AN02str TaxID=3423363 RepID=UPI003D315A7A
MSSPVIGIIMGSDSDLPTMQGAIAICEQFGVPCEVAIVSAHRTPERMVDYAKTAHQRGIQVIIAGAGGAAHLPGMVASLTPLPVIGVPVLTKALQGVDSLYSIVQMPAGIPVATVAIGNAQNAGLLAIRILASHDPELQAKVLAYAQGLNDMVMGKQQKLEDMGYRDYLQQMG